MTFSISFLNKETTQSDTVVIGVLEGNNLLRSAKNFDKMHNNVIAQYLKAQSVFKGKNGQTLVMSVGASDLKRVVLLGLGEKNKLDVVGFEELGGKLYKALKGVGAENIDVIADDIEQAGKKVSMTDSAVHLASGMKLKSYKFDKYQAKKEGDDKPTEIVQVNVIITANSVAKKDYAVQEAITDGVFLARDLVNEPPNTLHPESYAEKIREELKPLGVAVEILDEKKMTKLGFGALLSVGQGSIRESRTVIMRWNGAGKVKKGEQAPIALVGKGVTFDTGGISLKPGAEMDLMKMDMGGSAAVVGAMKAIAGRKAKANVIGIVGLVENMPSDRAYRPGDIITSHAGKTIEVLNTDAEGRLVLADAITYIQETYNPKVVIDLATLTGAIMVALGFEYCGAFVNSDNLWKQLSKASDTTGEKMWRMPLDAAYRKEVESEVADLRNLGNLGRYGGACSAAAFLEHFVNEGTEWAHIDIAGTAWWKTDKATTPKGGTGFPVRALNAYIAQNFEK